MTTTKTPEVLKQLQLDYLDVIIVHWPFTDTTLQQPTKKLAGAAAEQILARLSSPHTDVAALQLDAELLIGGSVARRNHRLDPVLESSSRAR